MLFNNSNLKVGKLLSTKKGWRVETVNDLINRLKQDIIDNKMKLYKTQLDSFDELSRIVRERLFQENYKIVLDLIRDGVEKNLLSYEDAAKLNFYILMIMRVLIHYLLMLLI